MIALHHVQVSCPPGGENAARAFYGGVLALTEVAKAAGLAARGGVWFRDPGVEVHVGVEVDFRPAPKAHPAFVVDDVDAVARAVERSGHAVHWDGEMPGYRRFHTADGAGNRVEILALCD